ncbi:MAG TPA: MFS transporter [Actinomycetes bacterium]|nr:MFS transporter [Actinomycetes bacterium]
MPAGLFTPALRTLTVGLVLTVTLVAFEALAVITILPAIKDDLGGLRLYGWVTSAFFLGTLVGIVVAGEEADRRGPAPPYVLGILLFAAGLTIGGLAPTMLVLVLARALQGIGAGAIPATAYASIGRSYPEALRPRLFAVLSTAWVAPGLLGPALSALVATHLGWRYVFLGLLPLVLFAAALALPALRRLGRPSEAVSGGSGGASLLDAVRVAAGAGALLSGLMSRSPLLALPLVAVGALVGLRPLLRLLPVGTLRARHGLPIAILSRGLLTFAFFGADTYVPLAITAVKGYSTAVASIAVTAATLTWALGAWIQERRATAWSSRRLVRTGVALLVAGIAAEAVSLLGPVPVSVAIAGWGLGGLGVGLAYSPISVTVLGLAPVARQGRASAQLQLSDMLGTALGAGLGGVLIAVGVAADWPGWVGLAGAFVMAGAVALANLVLARRLPDRKVAALRATAGPAEPAA